MRVAVVGATGLIGGAVVRALSERGDEVVALVRGGRDVPGARVVAWDPAAGPVPEGALEGCDAAVNLAGSTIGRRWNDDVKYELVASRIPVTEQLVAAIGADGPRVLVNGSAVGYYGNRDEPVDESAAPGSGFLAQVCVRWEEAAAAAEANGVRVVRLRTGIVLARDGGALPQLLTPAKLGLSGPIGGGRQWFPWVHLDDTVRLILRALDDGRLSGPVNVVAPGIVRQGEFARILGRVLRRPALMPVPAFAMKLLFGEGAEFILEGQNAVPAAALSAGYTFAFDAPRAALEDLVGGG